MDAPTLMALSLACLLTWLLAAKRKINYGLATESKTKHILSLLPYSLLAEVNCHFVLLLMVVGVIVSLCFDGESIVG